MSYVVDTVAFVRYLQDELPPAADRIFKAAERGEAVLLVPQIVLGEFIYLSLKGRLKVEDPDGNDKRSSGSTGGLMAISERSTWTWRRGKSS